MANIKLHQRQPDTEPIPQPRQLDHKGEGLFHLGLKAEDTKAIAGLLVKISGQAGTRYFRGGAHAPTKP